MKTVFTFIFSMLLCLDASGGQFCDPKRVYMIESFGDLDVNSVSEFKVGEVGSYQVDDDEYYDKALADALLMRFTKKYIVVQNNSNNMIGSNATDELSRRYDSKYHGSASRMISITACADWHITQSKCKSINAIFYGKNMSLRCDVELSFNAFFVKSRGE